MRTYIKSFSVMCASALLVSCAKEKLVPLTDFIRLDYVNVKANFCTTAPAPSLQKVKYIFVIDHSQSNQGDFDNAGTDMDASRRYGPMIDFAVNNQTDPNNINSFSLIDFNDAAYQPGPSELDCDPKTPGQRDSGFDYQYCRVGMDSAKFAEVARADGIGTGTEDAPQPRDLGFTDYVKALESVERLIKNDAKLEVGSRPLIKSTYKIIFVSDGIPRISTTEVRDFDTEIKPLIDGINQIADDPLLGDYISGIQLNTVYYHLDSDHDALELLQKMAIAGNGQSQDFGAGQSILYQVFAPPVKNLKNKLVDVFVENKNAVWWDNGVFMKNEPGDGLPDSIKEIASSGPLLADSDLNGVNDLVEFRTKGPCTNGECTFMQSDDYALCDGYDLDPTATRQFRSTAKDGFNDCEKRVLGAELDTFDSNGDFIPDFLEFKNQLAFIKGTNETYLTPFNDGMNNYMKIKSGLPKSIALGKVPADFRVRKLSLVHVDSPDPLLDCYELNVNDVATLTPNDTIRVWMVQNAGIVEDNPFLRTAEKNLAGNPQIIFTNEDFK
jgi:hypothetical protein